MGAWSHEPFANDTASDWVDVLMDATNLSHIEATLDRVLEASDSYVEATDAEEAVAAVAVVAQLLGRSPPITGGPEGLQAWITGVGVRPSAALLDKARRVVDRVLAEDSELAELWDDSESAADWRTSMAALRQAVTLD
ncbi:MAG: DUF4259 domain-containing protein [Burkholderiales bacterium]|jgi:hypothetical protein|nr:DUF4259 domain-containing protein [Burkholderiales bacterium]